jgi:hypothetical protein
LIANSSASALRIFEPTGGRIFFPDIIGLLKIGGDFKGLRILSDIAFKNRSCSDTAILLCY